MTPSSKADFTVDSCWHLCPVPILMTEEKMNEMKDGQVLQVIFTDPGARPDLEAWCKAWGHTVLRFEDEKLKSSAFIRKGR